MDDTDLNRANHKTTFSEHMERLRAIINLLSTEYQEASYLIGFLIERTPEKRAPAYRLVGHVKWPYAADLDRVMAPKQYRKVREG